MLIDYPPLPVLARLVREEVRQRSEEGCVTGGFNERWERSQTNRAELAGLYDDLCALEVSPDFPFVEPSDLASIRADRANGPRNLNWRPSDEELLDKMNGAWLGRCCGCALGKPVEMAKFMFDYRPLRDYLKAAGAYPLADYIPNDIEAATSVGLPGGLQCPESHRGRIAYMESDDDIRYTILGLTTLEKRGRDFDRRDTAEWLLTCLGTSRFHMATEVVYRNFVLIDCAHSWDMRKLSEERMDWVRGYLNPYREMLNARIRADGWAYGAAGNPELAAEFSFRDGSLTHVKNGLYGAMFFAAMIAAAFVLNDPREIVETALTEIPTRSRLHADVRKAVAICDRHHCDANAFEAVLAELWEAFGTFDPVHTPNNTAVTVAALLLGQRDFEKVITLAVMGGWDTDCNGASAGSICGAMLGAKALPEKWTAPLNDTLLAETPGFHPIPISDCARRSAAVWKTLTPWK